jgi:hypothetical protein
MVFSRPRLAFAAPVDGADHIAEFINAQVKPSRVSEHTIIKLRFVLLRVLGGVAYALSVLFFGVASPHCVDGFLIREKNVCVLHKHARMTHFRSDLVVLALAVAVTKPANFGSFGDDALNLDTHFVFGSSLLSELHRVVDHLVIKCFAGRSVWPPIIVNYFKYSLDQYESSQKTEFCHKKHRS